MGNNQAYSDWEAVVIATYDSGVLSRELLSKFMKMHGGSDIDSGGKVGTLSKDGLDCEEIVLKVFGVDIPKAPRLPKDWRKWTRAQEAHNVVYWNARYEAFSKITKKFRWC